MALQLHSRQKHILLHDAIKEYNMENIVELINSGIQPLTTDIQVAIIKHDKKLVKYLLKSTKERFSPLYGVAMQIENENIIQLLFKYDVIIDENLLMYCIFENKIDYFKKFILVNPKAITGLVIYELIIDRNDHSELISEIISILCSLKIEISDLDILLYTAKKLCPKIYEELHVLDLNHELGTLIDHDVEKKINKAYIRSSINSILLVQYVTSKELNKCVQLKSVELARNLLQKYNKKINDDVMLTAEMYNPEIFALYEKYNEKYNELKN